jgi:hypothetical protein
MTMPDLRTATAATVDVVPQLGMDGRSLAVVIIKRAFQVTPRNQVAPLAEATIRHADEPLAEEPPSSIRFPSDVCIHKPSTDVVMVGSAVAPDGRKVTELDVFLRVGPVTRSLRVTGARAWYRTGSGLALSSPQPFESVPLTWENAYGGFDASDPKQPPLEEPRNPVGRGVARDPATLIHKPGPQIEDPRDPVKFRGTMSPVGVAPIGRHWEPRRRYTGTMSEAWMEERMPLLPVDFDDRFNQVAPPELITPAYLTGGEVVQAGNVSAEGPMQFTLPRLHFFVGTRTDRGLQEHRPVLDTVLIQGTARAFEMTWRAVVPIPRPADQLKYIQVHDKRVL